MVYYSINEYDKNIMSWGSIKGPPSPDMYHYTSKYNYNNNYNYNYNNKNNYHTNSNNNYNYDYNFKVLQLACW